MAHAGQSNLSLQKESPPPPDLSTLPNQWHQLVSIPPPDIILVTESNPQPSFVNAAKVGQQSGMSMHDRRVVRTAEITDGANLAFKAFRKRMATGATVEIPERVFQAITTSGKNDPPSYPKAIKSLTSSVPGIVFHSQQALKFAERMYMAPGDLEKQEVAVLNLFLRQFGRDEQCLYEIVQHLLLCADRTRLCQFEPFLEFLSRTLEKLPLFRGNVWHKSNKDLAEDYPKDYVFCWKAFLSCSLNFESMEENSDTCRGTLFSISTSSGRMIHHFTEGLVVPEVLIQPGTYFQVVSVLDTGSGVKIIQLREVGCLEEESEQNLLLSPSTSEVPENTTGTQSSSTEPKNQPNPKGNRSNIAHILTTMEIALSLADIRTQERCLDCIAQVRADEIWNDSQAQLLRRYVTYIMEVYQAFSDIQIKGCRALMTLSRQGDPVTDMVQQASISVVLAAVERHTEVVSLHEEGLELLVELCSDSALVRMFQVRNGIEKVLCSMRQHSGNKKVNELGCRLLSKIASINRDTVSTIHKNGGVKDVVGAMKLLRGELSLQMSGWRALLTFRGESILIDDEHERSRNSFISEILRAMELYTKQVAVQAEGLLALRNLTENDTNTVPTRGSISIAFTLATLRSHSQNEVVAENGCAILADLTRTRNNSHEMASDGGISCLLSVMQQHFNIATIQEQATRTLRNLATNGFRGPSIEDDPSIPGSDTMSPDSSHVPTNDLTSYSQGPLHDYRLAIAEAGGKEIILLAMKTHPHHVGIQRQGCLALRTLSVSLANEVDAVKTDDVKVILSALTRHCSSIPLQRAALRALVVLAVNPQNKAAVAKCGGLEVILFSLSTHPDDEKLQEDGVNMLKELSLNAFAGNHIARQGGLGIVLSSMSVHSTNPRIQKKGCEILANISSIQETPSPRSPSSNGHFDSPCNTLGTAPVRDLQDTFAVATFLGLDKWVHDSNSVTVGIKESVPILLAEAGVIEHIVRAMQTFPKDATIQKHCCRALAALAVCTVNINMILGLSGLDLVLSAMRQHPMNAVIQLEGCRAVCKVYSNKELCNFESGLDATDVVISAMNLHSQDNAIQIEGCKTLVILVHDTQNRSKMVEYGAIDAVLTAMRIHHGDVLVQNFGCRFLVSITHLPTLLSEFKSIFFSAPEMTSRAQIICGGRLDTVLQTMGQHEDNRNIQMLCIQLLLCLSSDRSSRKRIIAKGGKDLVKGTKDRFVEDKPLQMICADLLAFIGESASD